MGRQALLLIPGSFFYIFHVLPLIPGSFHANSIFYPFFLWTSFVPYIPNFQDRDNLYFVMDYIPGGDLMSLLIKFGIFQEELAQ